MADPTKKRLLTENEIKQCGAMAGLGLTKEQMAAIIGIGKATLERRMKDQPALADALLKGRSEASAKVRKKAFEMAVSGKCPTMTIFWLKTKEGFREDREGKIKVVL